jgi:hypothetical protein
LLRQISPFWSAQRRERERKVWYWWRGYWRSDGVAATTEFKLVREGNRCCCCTWLRLRRKMGCVQDPPKMGCVQDPPTYDMKMFKDIYI